MTPLSAKSAVEAALGTMGEGTDQGQEGAEGNENEDAGLEEGAEGTDNTGDEAGEEGEEEQDEGDEPGEGEEPDPDKPEEGKEGKEAKPKPGEAADSQDSELDKAVANLEKVLNKELTDDDAIDELAKSHNRAQDVITDKVEQIKGLATDLDRYVDFHDKCWADPRIKAILEGSDPTEAVIPDAAAGVEGEISPAVKKQMASMQTQIDQFKGQGVKAQTEKVQQMEAQAEKDTDKFADAKGNEDFKQAWDSWKQTRSVNKYAKAPPKLRQWAAMCDTGIDPATAWGALNPDKITTRIKTRIAKENKIKLKRGSKFKKSAAKGHSSVEDADNVGELMTAIAEKVSGGS